MAKKTRLSEEQIRAILAEQAAGVAVGDIIKKHRISAGSFYNWKSKFGGEAMKSKRGRPKGAVRVTRPAAPKAAAAPASSLREENDRLKVMLVDLMLERDRLRILLARR